ncbi:MAG: hypothetical protein AAFO77_01345 [Pseudomonadota bacterium]
MLPLFAAEWEYEDPIIQDDPLMPTNLTGDISGWATDGYTREGKQAINLFLLSDADMAQMARHTLPPN